jgi:hypothetical protein
MIMLTSLVLATLTSQVDPGPEPTMEQFRDALLEQMAFDLQDPGSVEVLWICTPSIAEGFERASGGEVPDRWVAQVAFNARNRMGGYTGITRYSASYRDGQAAPLIRLGRVRSMSEGGSMGQLTLIPLSDCTRFDLD